MTVKVYKISELVKFDVFIEEISISIFLNFLAQ